MNGNRAVQSIAQWYCIILEAQANFYRGLISDYGKLGNRQATLQGHRGSPVGDHHGRSLSHGIAGLWSEITTGDHQATRLIGMGVLSDVCHTPRNFSPNVDVAGSAAEAIQVCQMRCTVLPPFTIHVEAEIVCAITKRQPRRCLSWAVEHALRYLRGKVSQNCRKVYPMQCTGQGT